VSEYSLLVRGSVELSYLGRGEDGVIFIKRERNPDMGQGEGRI